MGGYNYIPYQLYRAIYTIKEGYGVCVVQNTYRNILIIKRAVDMYIYRALVFVYAMYAIYRAVGPDEGVCICYVHYIQGCGA